MPEENAPFKRHYFDLTRDQSAELDARAAGLGISKKRHLENLIRDDLAAASAAAQPKKGKGK